MVYLVKSWVFGVLKIFPFLPIPITWKIFVFFCWAGFKVKISIYFYFFFNPLSPDSAFECFHKETKCQTKLISIYTLSDLGVLSNLIGSLSLANEHYSPPTEWIMRKPNENKMAGVKSRFASVSESIFNGFLLKMLLRSLPVYILKQLFFSISVNSGRIFTSPLPGSVNILPLFTSISKNNC